MAIPEKLHTQTGEAEPTWEIAHLFPYQGHWTVEEYLSLANRTNHLIEFSDGVVEVLPMPTHVHQIIAAILFEALSQFVRSYQLGVVLFAPLRIRVRPKKYRQPDILVLLAGHEGHIGNQYWSYADLVIEIVSPDDPQRDLVTKRMEYATGGIPEYWIVDPRTRRVLVLRLAGEEYAVYGDFGPGQMASSALLEGFAVAVDDLFRVVGSIPEEPVE